jgi:hypothetical protein
MKKERGLWCLSALWSIAELEDSIAEPEDSIAELEDGAR